MARRLDFHSANFAADFDALLDSKRESDSDVHDAVASIIADIRNHGDQALLALTILPKFVLLIPHYFVLYVLQVAALMAVIVGLAFARK